MNTTAHRSAATIAAVALLALAACSSAPPSSTSAAEASAAALAKAARTPADNGSITGSRIPAKSTDRLVRATGNAGARDMERERGPDPGALNNRP